MIRGPLAAALGLLAHLAAGPAAAGIEWLPQNYDAHPRARADWKEPRLGMTWHGETLEAALGAPMVLAAGPGWGVTVEGLASLGLGRHGAFFPLETVDGIMLLGVETSRGAWRGKLRAAHQSAHKADGDTSVAYRDRTFSREWASLEGGRRWGPVFAYLRLGRTWHAVPKSPGWKVSMGWILDPGPGGGPAGAGHWQWNRDREYRVSHSHFLGWGLGADNRVYLGLRHYRGFSPRAQYDHRRVSFWGMEIQFRPRARPGP